MSRGKPNKRYTPEFKKLVVETMMEERLSYCETARRFEVRCATQVKNWERIYLEEGSEALAVERRQHKTLVVQKLRQKYSLNLLLSIAQLPRATFYYHLKQMRKTDKYTSVKPAIFSFVKPPSGLDKRKYRRQQAEKSTTPKGRRECADLTI